MENYDIFISYRRDGGSELAQLLYSRLTADGYRVFFDVESMRSGKFNKQLYSRIDACLDMLVLLPPHALDPRDTEEDWVRMEIAHALKQEKNIIPVLMRNFSWPDSLPEDINELRYCHGVTAAMDYFDAVYDRIKKLLTASSATVQPEPSSEKVQIERMVHAADVQLANGEFGQAKAQYQKVLEQDASCSAAYLGLVMTEYRVRNRENFRQYYSENIISTNSRLLLASEYADEDMRAYLDSLTPPHCNAHQVTATARCQHCGGMVCPDCAIIAPQPGPLNPAPWVAGKRLCPDCMQHFLTHSKEMQRKNLIKIIFHLILIFGLVTIAIVMTLQRDGSFFETLGLVSGLCIGLVYFVHAISTYKENDAPFFSALIMTALAVLVCTFLALPVLVFLVLHRIYWIIRMCRYVRTMQPSPSGETRPPEAVISAYYGMVQITRSLQRKEPNW